MLLKWVRGTRYLLVSWKRWLPKKSQGFINVNPQQKLKGLKGVLRNFMTFCKYASCLVDVSNLHFYHPWGLRFWPSSSNSGHYRFLWFSIHNLCFLGWKFWKPIGMFGSDDVSLHFWLIFNSPGGRCSDGLFYLGSLAVLSHLAQEGQGRTRTSQGFVKSCLT